ncbi:hypothetical protein JCM3770_002573 [Rhodotorula araucariae]
MAYTYPSDYGHAQGHYPPANLYSRDPYAPAPSPGAADYPDHPAYPYAHPEYAHSDFVSPDRDGQPVPGGRQTYPPHSDDLDKFAHAAAYEKQAAVTRGSIAAQLAAEGSIPKKEGLRMFRKDEHAGALTRGGRARCCGRVFCCSLILVVLILVGIVAAFFLWVKPPDVGFEGIEGPESGDQVSVADGGFNLNFRLKINVINPNFFGADFDKIDATAYYPLKPTSEIGGGQMKRVSIKKYSNSTLHFPFAINYTTSYDSDLSVLSDIADKCGFLGTAQSQLTVNYKVKAKVKIIAVSIAPSFSSSTSFDCPLSESDITGFLGGSVSSLLGGGSRRLLARGQDAGGEEETPLDPEKVALATRHALAKLVARGAEELVGEVFAPQGRRYRIGTVGFA